MASAFALRLRARWLSSGPADSQPVARDTRNHMMLLTCVSACCCVSACASLASSHACSVRVERVVHECAHVQGAGQRAWARHARPRRRPVRMDFSRFSPDFSPDPKFRIGKSGARIAARGPAFLGFPACRQRARATPLLHARRTAFVIDTLTGANFSASGSRGTAAI